MARLQTVPARLGSSTRPRLQPLQNVTFGHMRFETSERSHLGCAGRRGDAHRHTVTASPRSRETGGRTDDDAGDHRSGSRQTAGRAPAGGARQAELSLGSRLRLSSPCKGLSGAHCSSPLTDSGRRKRASSPASVTQEGARQGGLWTFRSHVKDTFVISQVTAP